MLANKDFFNIVCLHRFILTSSLCGSAFLPVDQMQEIRPPEISALPNAGANQDLHNIACSSQKS